MKKALFVLLFTTSLFAQEFNKLDDKGLKDGLWKGIYKESKRPRYEGTFSHGKEIGVFKYFDDTRAADVIATRDFSKEEGSAYTIFYDQKKNIVSEGKVINKLYEGEWKYYQRSSKVIMTIENYSKGKLEGVRKVFYPSGIIAEEIQYKNGLKEGFCKKYTENGIVIEESNFKNDLYNGVAIFKEADGKLASKGKFLNGKKVGVWEFYENGKLTKEVNLSNPKNINDATTKSKLNSKTISKSKETLRK